MIGLALWNVNSELIQIRQKRAINSTKGFQYSTAPIFIPLSLSFVRHNTVPFFISGIKQQLSSLNRNTKAWLTVNNHPCHQPHHHTVIWLIWLLDSQFSDALLASSCQSTWNNWTDFHEISYLSVFRKPVVTIQSDKNNRYFRYRPI
jgi:hypothetical protein